MNYTTVISESELSDLLRQDDLIVVDCRFTLTDTEAGQRAYAEGHIPGAAFMHLDDDMSSPVNESTGRHPLPDPEILANKLGSLGIDNDTQVVAYDETFGAMASRLWWLLRWMGHDKVALLDGGFPAWVRNKRAINKEEYIPTPKTFIPQLRPDMVVEAGDVVAILESNSGKVVDARAEERFTGEVEPLDKVAGHIPGAINLPLKTISISTAPFYPKAR